MTTKLKLNAVLMILAVITTCCLKHSLQTNVCIEGDIRLVGGDDISEGNVEYCYENAWGRICRRDFELDDAVVICRQLGFTDNATGVLPIWYPAFGVAPDSVPIWLDRLGCWGYESRLIDCPFYQTGVQLNQDCDHSLETIAVSCVTDQACIEGDIRLVGGDHKSEGNVEYCYHNAWGRVCRHDFELDDAVVICRQLGFADNATGVLPIWYPAFGVAPDSVPIWLDRLGCWGYESRLIDCPFYKTGLRLNQDCDQSLETIAVSCVTDQACIEGDIRLVGGDHKSEGNVEYCYHNAWGRVCRHDFELDDAVVICRQLGFADNATGVLPIWYPAFGVAPDSVPIWLDRLGCWGYESRLIDCPFYKTGLRLNQDCDQSLETIAVSCVTDQACIEGDIRLVGGDHESEGNVEYCYHNAWGRVCRHDFELDDAVVICRQLGFADNATGVLPIWYPAFGVAPDSVPIWLDRLGCWGNESKLIDCSFYKTGLRLNQDCDHSLETIAVSCVADQDCIEGDIRLVGGDHKSEGNVEYCYHNAWGRVCRRDFELDDAVVICRQLGFAENATGVKPIVYPAFGVAPDSVPIWLDRLGCWGNESRLIDCPFYQTGLRLNQDCDHSLETVAVSCVTDQATAESTTVQTSEQTSGQTSGQTSEQTSRTPTTNFDVSTTLVQRGSNGEQAVPVAELGGALGTVVVLGLLLFTVTVAVLIVLKRRKRRKIQNPQLLREYTTCTSLPLPEMSNVEKKFCTDDSSMQLDTSEDIHEELDIYEELQCNKSIPKHKAPRQVCGIDTAKNEAYMTLYHEDVCTKLQSKHAEESNGIYEIGSEAVSDSEVLTNVDTDSVATRHTTSLHKHAEESGGPGIFEMKSDTEVFTNVGTTISLAGARADTDINEDPLHTEEDGI